MKTVPRAAVLPPQEEFWEEIFEQIKMEGNGLSGSKLKQLLEEAKAPQPQKDRVGRWKGSSRKGGFRGGGDIVGQRPGAEMRQERLTDSRNFRSSMSHHGIK